jgi:hypothetical protein
MKKFLFLSVFTIAYAFASDDVFKIDAQSLKDAQHLVDCQSKGFGELCAQDIVKRYVNDCGTTLLTPFAQAACVQDKMALLEQKTEKLRKERRELEKLAKLTSKASANE